MPSRLPSGDAVHRDRCPGRWHQRRARGRRQTRAPGETVPRRESPLHHIGIGRAHAGTRVLLLVQDLDIRVSNAGTGELIRELVLNPDKNYQPTGRPSGWPKKTPRPLRGFAVSSMSCDITRVAGDGFEPS